MSSQLRAKKTYVLFPKPHKDLSIPDIKLNTKQKTKIFLQDLYRKNESQDEQESELNDLLLSNKIKKTSPLHENFSAFSNERDALGFLINEKKLTDVSQYKRKATEHLRTKIMKEHLTANAVLVKRNNFYFFEKGVQMKGKPDKNLFEKCFARTMEKNSLTPSHKPLHIKIDPFLDEYVPNESNFFYGKTKKHDTYYDDSVTPKNNCANSLDSVFMNSFTINQKKSPKKMNNINLKSLKYKISYQESNKNFELSPKEKTRIFARSNLGHQNNPLFTIRDTPPIGIYDPDFKTITQQSPSFKFSQAQKFSNEVYLQPIKPQEKIIKPPAFARKKDSLIFEREFARLMKNIKEEVNHHNPYKKQADEELNVKLFDESFLPIFHKSMTKSLKSAKDSFAKIKKGVMMGLEEMRKENFKW